MHRIALRALVFDRLRVAAALIGVAVATLLMLVQAGIYEGFASVASEPVRRIGGDVWVMSRDHRQLDHSPMLEGAVASRLRADPCVRHTRAAIFLFTTMRSGDGALEAIELVGLDAGPVVPWSMARGVPADLDARGAVTIDARDASLAGLRDPLGASLEIGVGRGRVSALSRGLRGNFGIHPIVFGRADTIRALASLDAHDAQYWVLDLDRPRCAASAIATIERDPLLRAERTADFAREIERDLLETSGIGIALGFIALLGFAVAGAVVGQTLVASLRQHRRELAMLKSLGARPSELVSFVVWQAGFLAVSGAALGIALVLCLRDVLGGLAIPVLITWDAIGLGAAVIVGLCAVASLVSVRAVLSIGASEVLR